MKTEERWKAEQKCERASKRLSVEASEWNGWSWKPRQKATTYTQNERTKQWTYALLFVGRHNISSCYFCATAQDGLLCSQTNNTRSHISILQMHWWLTLLSFCLSLFARLFFCSFFSLPLLALHRVQGSELPLDFYSVRALCCFLSDELFFCVCVQMIGALNLNKIYTSKHTTHGIAIKTKTSCTF